MPINQSPLDRQDALRKSDDALIKLWQEPSTRIIPIYQGQCLVTVDTHEHRMASLPVQSNWSRQGAIFLGTQGETAWFAITIDDEDPVAAGFSTGDTEAWQSGATPENGLTAETRFYDLRAVGPHLTPGDAELMMYAKGLSFWHKNTQHCDRCGSNLENSNGGHVKVCTNTDCAQQVFPRTDPAVIMLVTRTDQNGVEHCLLGRSPVWPEGMYSTLAGFVESGESLEQAVAREVYEESNIVVENVQYLSSQAWPFPRSIMLGFQATATTEEIIIDKDELDDAQWFTRDDLSNFGTWGDASHRYQLPRKDSIAHALISRWMTNP